MSDNQDIVLYEGTLPPDDSQRKGGKLIPSEALIAASAAAASANDYTPSLNANMNAGMHALNVFHYHFRQAQKAPNVLTDAQLDEASGIVKRLHVDLDYRERTASILLHAMDYVSKKDPEVQQLVMTFIHQYIHELGRIEIGCKPAFEAIPALNEILSMRYEALAGRRTSYTQRS